MQTELRPVYERGWQVSPDETPQLYDIYINGEWIGSRRTKPQCEDAIRSHANAR